MAASKIAVHALSISVALIGAGGIASLSLFDATILQAQPADRSLPAIRWLFSRGSHIFPQAAFLSAAGFAYSAYDALPQNTKTLSQLLKTTNGLKVNGFLAAAVLAMSIGPFTSYMIPNNFALIEKNEELGGARSQRSAEQQRQLGSEPGQGSAEDSVSNKRGVDEYSDLSKPQSKTARSSTDAEDKEVRDMLAKFARQNWVRAFLLGGGGIAGLVTALL
ncbi:hypothetical protein Slin15195_G027140 [Septoria linicola]|uniref:DUF1772-domain-containing protein n=1 Tax=Septoria linicola TaxID=215465 RepID=A0A9Q9EFX1_9PEZI|nr:hypothetical protein Slin15195_G027140 [Septoria linicola]